jgi:hypothetical protein
MRSLVPAKGATRGMLLALLLAGLVGWIPAQALMVEVPLRDSIKRSDTIIRARTLDQHCAWTADGHWIITLVRVKVLETLAGETPPEEVTLRVLGGSLDGVGLVVSDMPAFQQEEESVLFLQKTPDAPFYVVTDNAQGKNTLTDGRVVERGLASHDFLSQVRALARDLKR